VVEPLELFIAYSDKDEGLRESLEQSLTTLARSGQIKIWHDGKIAAGADRKKEIGENLSRAKIILLLLSSDFLESEDNDVELQEALKRRDADEAVVIPIILRPCQWQNSQLGRLQALPKNGKPVTKWSNKDEAFLHVVQEISRAIDKQRGGSRTA